MEDEKFSTLNDKPCSLALFRLFTTSPYTTDFFSRMGLFATDTISMPVEPEETWGLGTPDAI